MDTQFSLASLNNSKYLAGLSMLILNLGSKYISMELSSSHEELMSNKIFRRFIIFVSNLFNENSTYCLIHKPKNKFYKITKLDYEKAKQIIKYYELQNLKK